MDRGLDVHGGSQNTFAILDQARSSRWCDRGRKNPYSNRMAYGRANFIEVDNDLFGIEEGDKNTNTWAYSARGRLATSDGGTVRLNAFVRQQFGNEGGFKIVRKVQLN